MLLHSVFKYALCLVFIIPDVRCYYKKLLQTIYLISLAQQTIIIKDFPPLVTPTSQPRDKIRIEGLSFPRFGVKLWNSP